MKFISEIQNELTFSVKHESVCPETPNSPVDGHRVTESQLFQSEVNIVKSPIK